MCICIPNLYNFDFPFKILDIADLSDFSDCDSDTTIVPDGVSYFKYDGGHSYV